MAKHMFCMLKFQFPAFLDLDKRISNSITEVGKILRALLVALLKSFTIAPIILEQHYPWRTSG